MTKVELTGLGPDDLVLDTEHSEIRDSSDLSSGEAQQEGGFMKSTGRRLPRAAQIVSIAFVLMASYGVCLQASAALVQSTSAGSGASPVSSLSATFPTTPTSGHLLVAIVGVKAGDSIAGVSSTSGAWSSAINEPGSFTPRRPGLAIFYRIAGASEATQVTATTSPTTIGLQIFEYSGITPASPLEGTASNAGTGSAAANTGTVGTAGPNDLLLAGIAIDTPDSITGVSNGFTKRFDYVAGSSGGRETYASADRFDSAGNNNTTFSHGNNAWRAQIAAFKTGNCPAGVLMVDTMAVGYGLNNFTQEAANNVSFSFASSQAAANEYAIFQTHDPWGNTVVKTAIANAGHTYSEFTPGQLAGFTFSDYRVVVLNWDDHHTTDFQPDYGNAIAALEAYVNAGGVVWIQGAIQTNSGTNYPLPFGGTATLDLKTSNFVVDTAHPLAASLPNPISGNLASHAHLTGYPAEAHVVIVTGTNNTGLATVYAFGGCD
jgi:hypothetical protein